MTKSMTDETVTQADREAFRSICLNGDMGGNISKMLEAGAWDNDSRMLEIVRHRTAHSGEGRINGAGEDADGVFAAVLEELDRECRCAAVRGEDGKRVGLAVLRKHFGPAMLLARDEFAPLTNSALRAALSAHQGEVEQGSAIDDIAAERRRQVEAEGWTPDHDDEHGDGSLAAAAATYAFSAATADRFLA
ncbi:MAG: hypothetical protein DI569_12810, partial [Sphingopyxis macrogoltabida]